MKLFIKSLRLYNFKCYEKFQIDFIVDQNNSVVPYCLFGPNGSGKTTVLDAITCVLSSYSSYDVERIHVALSKYIRNFKNMSTSEQQLADFLIEADICSEFGNYTVAVNKFGYVPGKEHPDAVREQILKLCFRTRYDEELNMFQLRLDRWDLFKELFEATTGYSVEKIEYETPMFSDPASKAQRALLDDYVLQLIINKPNETITDRECSKGEKKVIKNFTTLLNKDILPPVILIDDVEMHVEIDRHMKLVRCIEKCFAGSQVVFTTHSPKIIHNYDIDRMCDLTSKEGVATDLWRKKLIRYLNRITYFETKTDILDRVYSMIKELHNNKSIDKQWSKNVVSELVFEAQNSIIGDIEQL